VGAVNAEAEQVLAVAAEALADDPTVIGIVVVTLRLDEAGYHTAVLTNMSAEETANLMGNQAVRMRKAAAQ
jgi:hypothetical protein